MIKATGIVRKIDELGRIVIPMEIRRSFNIDIRDPLEIFVESDKIVLSKPSVKCIFCGSNSKLKIFKGKNICSDCSDKLLKKL